MKRVEGRSISLEERLAAKLLRIRILEGRTPMIKTFGMLTLRFSVDRTVQLPVFESTCTRNSYSQALLSASVSFPKLVTL